jgi:rSAM/selenodomain-associated transferase 2
MISIIIPALDEEKALPATLAHLADQTCEREVIVVDGGSSDATCAIAEGVSGVRLLRSPRGRALQMNAGAHTARGDWLLFLHADTWLPPDGLARIASLPAEVDAGCFQQRFSGDDWRLRFVSRLHNFRCRCTGVMYGDQAMFVRRSLFERLGGFPPFDALEDIALSERILTVARPRMMPAEVVTDSRKFMKMGVFRSLARCLVILLCYELRLPIPARPFFAPIR